MKLSDDVNKKQLTLAKRQGSILQKALRERIRNVAREGDEAAVGDYKIAYLIGKPAGVYKWAGKKLKWIEPKKENLHVEISVRDFFAGRFIPYLDIQVSFLNLDGKEIFKTDLPFIWHPWFFHYGKNVKLPKGNYLLRVKVQPPKFLRQDHRNGDWFSTPVEINFADLKIK